MSLLEQLKLERDRLKTLSYRAAMQGDHTASDQLMAAAQRLNELIALHFEAGHIPAEVAK